MWVNDVLKDERRVLCDVLDQWEMRWCWTGDAVDQCDAMIRSRDRAQPMRSGGCCEGCWGGPGLVMPANQRGAAHIRCVAQTLTHVSSGGECECEWRWVGQWNTSRCCDMPYLISRLFEILNNKIQLIFILRIHVLWPGYWHHASANEMLQHPHTAAGAGRLWPYVASWHHPMMARDVEISCVREK